VGGWGHLLGDHGSSYDIAFTALRRAILVYDLTGRWPQLGARLLRRLQFNEPNELIGWVKGAAKDEIAALAVEVFEAAKAGDKLAPGVLRIACEGLVADALACAKHLAGEDGPVEFILAGGTLLKQPRFAAAVKRALKAGRPNAKVFALERESAWGALELAAKRTGSRMAARAATVPSPIIQTLPLSPTEARNPRSMNLHRLPLRQAMDLMFSEEARILPAIKAERADIEKALRLVVRALKNGGRLFYVGAGTSGRLGVLDASECPPTFRTPPGMIQGIIAGGRRAIWEAVEGAEDDAAAGASAIKYNGVCRRDVVVGIAASGRTPFVWGALNEARAHGAKTVMLCFNPRLQVAPDQRPDVLIAINTGPEILTGSTRLKAGTATKLVLNLLTTLAMVQLGKVAGNLMVDLLPSNAKLRDRAVRIVVELTGASSADALDALEKTGWVIKGALKKLGGINDSRGLASANLPKGLPISPKPVIF
jgi:N-acetylmuramic acid 6-phosphate etherase